MNWIKTTLLIALLLPVAVLAEAGPADREREQLLATGKIVKIEELPVGTTRPLKVSINSNNKLYFAVFKGVDISPRGVTQFRGQKPTIGFTDTFRHDRAAYVLDQLLELNMIPVTVIRKVQQKRGALVDWVPDAITELDRRTGDLKPENSKLLDDQWAVMRMFDALINNPDRNLGNQLYTRPDWKLHLIDHTRAFSRARKIPDTYREQWSRLPRRVYENLKILDPDKVRSVTRTLLSAAQVKDLFIRRDLIVKKIEQDMAALGEAEVFFE
jgi:hypothetical protein